MNEQLPTQLLRSYVPGANKMGLVRQSTDEFLLEYIHRKSFRLFYNYEDFRMTSGQVPMYFNEDTFLMEYIPRLGIRLYCIFPKVSTGSLDEDMQYESFKKLCRSADVIIAEEALHGI
jgi:hypothetical protein